MTNDQDPFKTAFLRDRGRVDPSIVPEIPPGWQMLMSADTITDDELTALLSFRPQTVWRDGDRWRLCRWAFGDDAETLLADGWRVFDDW